jgi:hypothetical protein
MSEEELNYVKENYRNPVMVVFNKALTEFKKIFNEKNFEFEIQDEEILNYFNDYEIFDFFKNIYTDGEIIEPESVLTFHIKEAPISEDGRIIQNERIPIHPYIVSPEKIIYKDKTTLIFEVKGENKYNYIKIEEGLTYSYYSFNDVVRDREVPPVITIQIPFEGQFWRPVDGIKVIENNELHIKSYFDKATPKLKDIIFNSIDRSIIEARFNYPQAWRYADTCNECSGEGECTDVVDDTVCQVQCKSCKGSGFKNEPSILRTLQVPFPRQGIDTGIAPPFAGFLTPPTEPQKYLTERIEKDLEMVFDWLNVSYSNTNVKGSETALGKMIDREERYSTLSLFTQDMLTSMQWFTKMWEGLMFGTESINVSANFDFKVVSLTEQNATYTELLKEGAPLYILQGLLYDIYKKRGELELFEIVDKYYLYLNFTDLRNAVASGLFTKKAAVISMYCQKWVYNEGININNAGEIFSELADEILMTEIII